MAENSMISWTDDTFNHVIGCTAVSPGCRECYAEALANNAGPLGLRRLLLPLVNESGKLWGPSGPRYVVGESTWRKPLKWNRDAAVAGRPRFVFCASLSDVAEDLRGHRHEAQVDAARARLWALVEATPALVWLLLTKRPERVEAVVPASWMAGKWPVNAWIGCTVEDTRRAGERLPHLLALPAPQRFVSYEPALEAVDFGPWLAKRWPACSVANQRNHGCNPLGVLDGEEAHCRNLVARCPECWRALGGDPEPLLSWIIVGGESGPHARAFDLQWARDVVRQGRQAEVPVWVKQLGAHPVRKNDSGLIVGLPGIRDRAGANPAEWPADLRVQQRPEPEPRLLADLLLGRLL